MARGLEKPPWWAVVVIVVGLVFLIVGLPFALKRGGEPLSRAELDRMAAAASAADASEAAATPPRVVFLGDSYTAASSYPDQVAAAMGWEATSLGQIGTGYINDGGQPDTGPFADRLPQVVEAQPDIVIVQGSPNDTGAASQPGSIHRAAADLYTALRAQLPDARIIVVGPTLVPDRSAQLVRAVRDELADATTEAGLPFIDPVALAWLPEREQYRDDGLHPTEAGYQEYAERLTAELKLLVDGPAGN